ncbi:lipid-A-disaccharide kinase [Polynucleobacter meluiroseus]|uniref:Tetraacyldisaccharide 4'-kinase n=1 Tax=Polynucleobacter meluiroseus TaxID=1938814 RepID=A0A240E0V9_9BURK|nr:tetraacyldisaccharide 4'-kinase [Polynucleobacter meluiroseus]SNX29075.1 lipid-A-disaccharide kinase [Polynucleobacter meluiroseus]
MFRKAPAFWEKRGPISFILWPLSLIYSAVLQIRKLFQDLGLWVGKPVSVPVIIVGNIRVGGTGKTPIVIAVAQQLAQLGWKPGIISRGYGAKTQIIPLQVRSDSDPALVGDEPVLIAKLTHDNFPIWVFPQRSQSIAALLKQNPEVNVIVSDDGLQHAGLSRWPAREGGRDIEFVVRDARGEGNSFLLPAGPLREPATRERDATLIMGSQKAEVYPDGYFLGQRAFNLTSQLGAAFQLHHPHTTLSLADIATQYLPAKMTAVAAIGNPQRFFDDLQTQGICASGIALPDHSTFHASFFDSINAECILITEKDAVKCAHIQDERIWVVPMTLAIPDTLSQWMQAILARPDPHQPSQ